MIIMDDVGEDSLALKDFIKEGKVSVDMAKEIGAAIGAFLGGLHKWGRGNEELCASVKGNAQAKTLSAWVFYGRLEETLTGAVDVPKLLDPPLVVDEEDLRAVVALAKETTEALLAAEHSVSYQKFVNTSTKSRGSSSWVTSGQETSWSPSTTRAT